MNGNNNGFYNPGQNNNGSNPTGRKNKGGNNALLIAIIALIVVVLGVGGLLVYNIFFDDDTYVSQNDNDDDDDDDDGKKKSSGSSSAQKAKWEGYEDAVFTEFLEALPYAYGEDDLKSFTVNVESGWKKSEDLDEEDLSDGAKAYTYKTRMEKSENSWLEHHFFMELKDGILEAKGGVIVEREPDGEYESEAGKSEVESFLDALIEQYEKKESFDKGVPEGIKAYGQYYFGMSMDEVKEVSEGTPKWDGNQLQYFEDDFYEVEDDESIIASANCDTIFLDFRDDKLVEVALFADNLSYAEAGDVYSALLDTFEDGEYEFEEEEDGERGEGTHRWTTDDVYVYATLSYIKSASCYRWYISIEYIG